jgi:type IX secretion system PorP/SprF family membrane protein
MFEGFYHFNFVLLLNCKKESMKKIYLLFIFTLVVKNTFSQDADFTQFYNQTLHNNPAQAGVNGGLRASAVYRNLWNKTPGKFNTFCAAADIEALNYGGGLGIIATNDIEGEGLLKTTSIGGIYAYRFVVIPKDFIIQTGFKTDVITQNINYNKLVFSDQIDDKYGLLKTTSPGAVALPQVSKTFVDFTFGALARINSKRKQTLRSTATIGFAVHHVTQPDQSLLNLKGRLPLKFSAQASWVKAFKNSDKKNIGYFIPSALLEIQSPFRQFLIGANLMKAPLFGGVFFRNKFLPGLSKDIDAVIVDFGADIKFNAESSIRVCYSYDITINYLRGSTPGTHEIGIVAQFRNLDFNHHDSNRPKKIDCYIF